MLEIETKRFRKIIEHGIPLETLEEDFKPKGKDRSNTAYLGSNESLLEVVHSDWETLEKYGVTHEIIARQIQKVLKKLSWDIVRQYSRDKKPLLINENISFIPPVLVILRGYNLITLIKNGFTKEQRGLAEWAQRAALDELPITREVIPGIYRTEEEFQEIVYLHEHCREGLNVNYTNISERAPSLIRKHRFFGGRESLLRADPEFLIKAFNLA